MAPDIGVFASLDIVAIDMAILDKINAAPIMPGAANGLLEDLGVQPGDEKFKATQGNTPRYQLEAARKLELGRLLKKLDILYRSKRCVKFRNKR